MADRVELAFRRAALRLLPEEGCLLVAVSGGADSVALLHLLVRHTRRRPLSLVVAHLDHGLRPGSVADRQFVKRISADLSLDCVSERRPVSGLRRKDESPEEAARRVRRAFLMEAAREVGASRIATGHNMDDQAETVLMRLVRGAGPSAVSGMAPSGPGPFVRPLLGIERSDLRAYLGRRGIEYREDPSNLDLRFDRNRVRRLVVPLLSEKLNPKAARHLVEAAERLREDSAFLDGLAGSTYRRLRSRGAGKDLRLPAHLLAQAPPPLARRIARLAIEEAGADPRRIASRHIEAILRLATGEGGKRMNLPGRHEALRHKDSLILR